MSKKVSGRTEEPVSKENLEYWLNNTVYLYLLTLRSIDYHALRKNDVEKASQIKQNLEMVNSLRMLLQSLTVEQLDRLDVKITL